MTVYQPYERYVLAISPLSQRGRWTYFTAHGDYYLSPRLLRRGRRHTSVYDLRIQTHSLQQLIPVDTVVTEYNKMMGKRWVSFVMINI
jgi:hypothetical protein